ncbi:MAG: ATP-binding protein [Thermodesulfobacteriota bacterium]|nr:ATP-binding protein [Thermodesulfobacteriota bacterium]
MVMDDTTPLYNSRIVRNYTEYLEKYYQDVDIEAVLKQGGISQPELNDHGHWFSQSQVDHFHEVIHRETNDPDLPRKVGRYYASSEGLGAARQYILGMLNVPTGYRLMGKIYTLFSRSMNFEFKNPGRNYIELVFTPRQAVIEKPFQCQNRFGAIESLCQLFTGRYPEIEHPYCIHNGDACCQYNVTWQVSPAVRWKNIIKYSIPLFVLAWGGAYFLVPVFAWLSILLGGGLLFVLGALRVVEREKQQTQQMLFSQGNTEEMLLNEVNARFDNALFIQNIGKATSAVLKETKIIDAVTQMMRSHLDFDRGVVLLLDEADKSLFPAAGYGYDKDGNGGWRDLRFHLDDAGRQNVFVKAFKEQKTLMMGAGHNGPRALGTAPPPREIICAPMVFDGSSMGVVAVDNLTAKRPLTQSDEHLINGIASQIAVSIVNARAYVKIAESENRYRLIAENAADAIWLMDAGTLTYTYMSPAVEKILGYKPDDFQGRGLDLTLNGDNYRQLRAILEKEFRPPLAASVEDLTHIMAVEQFHREGHAVWTEITVQPLIEGAGYTYTILGITRDITERIHAEQQKRQLEDQLRIARKMEAIGKFAGGIAHDFNNILNVVVLNAEMGRNSDDVDVEGKDCSFQQVRDSGRRARELVKQLLVFTSERRQSRKALCLAGTTRDTMKIVKSMIPESISLESHIPRREMPIYGDVTQVQQVIINLCVNAAQAMASSGSGRLSINLEAINDADVEGLDVLLSNGSGWMKLSVSDNGCGIHKDDQDKIFDPFFTTKGEINGTGLGLSIVHDIIAHHNGKITVDSTPGLGTTFHVFLPGVEPDAIIRDEPEAAADASLLKGNEHILLVDDELPVLKASEKLLNNLGYTVTAVNDSRTALDLFVRNNNSFDAVVTDMTMPHMTGLDLCESILSIRRDIPLIICTGHSDQLSPEQAAAAGIEYIAKPFKIRDIAAAIRRCLDAETFSP